MRLRLHLLVSIGILALATAACTKVNPHYCADAADFNCSALNHDAAAETGDAVEAKDTAEVSDGGADLTDVAVDLTPERPMCTRAGCDPTTPICDVDAGICHVCTAAAECTDRDLGLRACDNGQCYECKTNDECNVDVKKPICTAHQCGACVLDSDCKSVGAGVCMEDGSCLASGDAVFAANRASGCPGTGTSVDPFCSAQLATTTALAGGKPAVILQGPGPFSVFAVNAPGKVLAVIAPDGASLVPGVDNVSGLNQVGISLTAGDLLIRGLEIKSGRTTAVDAEGGVIRLHRDLIHDNAESGLLAKSAGFDVENTVFADNGSGTKANVDLESTTSATKTFRNNTVLSASTTVAGIVCADADVIAGCIVDGASVLVGATCVFNDACASNMCSGQDPKVDPTTYALTAQSPMGCIGVLTSGAPALDRLGAVRPVGAGSCGADERGP
jgi:hypothetical protein